MTHPPSPPPQTAEPQPLRAVVRIRDVSHALRPLGIGVFLTGMTFAALAFDRAGALRLLTDGSARWPFLWAVPLVCSLAFCWGKTLWIDVMPQGVFIKRLLAGGRAFPASSVVLWGFECERGLFSTLPPHPTQARRVRFVLETTDGYRFDITVKTREAHKLAAQLLRQRI